MVQNTEFETPITIIGGGIGGLTLARVLQVNGIPTKVYESDTSRDARTQGGQLDIHEYNGQVALKKAQLTEAFQSIIQKGADAARIVGENGDILLDVPDDESNGRPEVLRGDLRNILIDSLKEDTIAWGKKVDHVEKTDNNQYKVVFRDETSIVTDKLIGADGAWSKVRKLLTNITPHYSGTTFIETYLYDVDYNYPKTAQEVGKGAMYALTHNKGIVAHREANNIIHTYVQMNCSEEWIDHIDFSNGNQAVQTVAAEFEGWASEIKALITETDSHIIPRKIYALPDEHRWAPQSGVTLIGDAAHLMAPSGEGANLAMLDGAELAELIAAHKGNFDTAIRKYEEQMFPRSEEEAKESHELLEICLGPDSPDSLIKLFQSADQ
ncbi:FAD-dependent oxidoreductase [Staphylococcus carnosus]|uniref:Flavin-dependent monooxygenase n=1 Tax=Staphylococcus carnosus TaxID=1281 RepID=A0AAJ0JMW0_STACA|nr:FAD-dependent monooxygenase [Staphylococcus carnosus]KKB24591.1 FAD-dependent oxidoreductase [Staphylococcus carnosus]POA07591.1 FAD-dependent monooxygenase [Staphylococcus carnosus]QQS86215.1 FAD-dependent monooxygenase [Staphylococcus carnosus]QRQ06150.1 FAD-dependent monooxygenase [Staphylococcus carnosus]UTB81854.1 FAD-dependent oxidoreductase [Staphylococcus carnosus]